MNLIYLLAQQQASPAEQMGEALGNLAVFACIIVVAWGIQVVICYLLYTCFAAIPVEHRKQQPGLVWLMLIPLFSLIWNFFVYPKLSESYQSYFASRGRTDVGTCGSTLAIVLPIMQVCTVIPCLGCLISIPTLVVLILFLIKAIELKNKVLQEQAMGTEPIAPVQ